MSQRRRVRPFAYLLLLLAAMLLIPSADQIARAQSQGDVTLTARAGFEGNCKQTAWIPIRVTLENKGPDLNAARVQAAYQNNSGGQSVYAAEVSLPSTSRKELFLYLYPQTYLGKLTVSLVVGDRTLVTTPLNLTCISDENLLIGLLTDHLPADKLTSAMPLTGVTRVASLRLTDLPDRSQGWDSLDALVVSGADMGAISDPQRAALKSWLAQGGKLLVTGGPAWQVTAGGLDEFLPLDLNTTRTVNDLSTLQAYFKISLPLAVSAPVTLAVGQLRPNAQVLVAQDGVPVLLQRPLGFGTVYYLAADPALQPLSQWDGMSALYSHLLGVGSLHPSWMNSAWDATSSNQALAALDALGLPPTLSILCLLGLYILVVGPLNYFVLRRLKRPELAWITIPVLVIGFTLVGYFSGFLLRGVRPILNRLAVVQAWDGVAEAQAQALVGVYSPIRTKYELQAGGSFLPSPYGSDSQSLQQANRDWLSLQHGLEVSLPDVLVESGGMKAASLSGSIPALAFTQKLVIALDENNPTLSGTITNASKSTLKNATLVTPEDMRPLGDLAPGATKQVQVSLSSQPQGSNLYNFQAKVYLPNYGDDVKTIRRSALLSAIQPSQYIMTKVTAGFYLIGWVDDALLPTGLQANGFQSVDTTLYILALAPTFTQTSGSLRLPPSLFTWESSDPDASPYEPDYYSGATPPGGYSLRFKLAAPLHYSAVQSLTFSLNQNTYTNTNFPDDISASLWDWDHSELVQIQGLVWGDMDIPDPSRFVGPGGEIILKIDKSPSQNPSQIGSSYFTLVVEP